MRASIPAVSAPSRCAAKLPPDHRPSRALLVGRSSRAITAGHLQACLDEFTIRYNRRKTHGVGRLIARGVLQKIVRVPLLTVKTPIQETRVCRLFQKQLWGQKRYAKPWCQIGYGETA